MKKKKYIVADFQIRGTDLTLQRITIVDGRFDRVAVADALRKYAADTHELIVYVESTYVHLDTIEEMTGLIPMIGLDKYLA